MNPDCNIMVLGDVHREFSQLNALIAGHSPELILQVGDLGYWPNRPLRAASGDPLPEVPIRTGKGVMHFCDGNHEDHGALRTLGENEAFPGVVYQPRGSTLTLPDGRVVLFAGGAQSIDREYREYNIDWFPTEVLSHEDLTLFPDVHVDIVISHTSPREFDPLDRTYSDPDLSRMSLSWVLHRYQPSLWYFGHFHRAATGTYGSTKWQCLHMAGRKGWWCWLPPAGTAKPTK